MTSLKRQEGFTLVELMVVVAIIGLLSAVAIPNFRKYQAKAKMSEAKLQLSSVYTAETAFFSDYNIYHWCLGYMGYNPQREVLNRYYAIGFATASTINTAAYDVAVTSGLSSAPTDCPNAATAADMTDVSAATGPTASVPGNAKSFAAGKGVGSAKALVAWLPTSAVGSQADQMNMTFTAGAVGVIDGDNTTDALASKLTIDHQKMFRVVKNGF